MGETQGVSSLFTELICFLSCFHSEDLLFSHPFWSLLLPFSCCPIPPVCLLRYQERYTDLSLKRSKGLAAYQHQCIEDYVWLVISFDRVHSLSLFNA